VAEIAARLAAGEGAGQTAEATKVKGGALGR
jgi:hypothetical protein